MCIQVALDGCMALGELVTHLTRVQLLVCVDPPEVVILTCVCKPFAKDLAAALAIPRLALQSQLLTQELLCWKLPLHTCCKRRGNYQCGTEHRLPGSFGPRSWSHRTCSCLSVGPRVPEHAVRSTECRPLARLAGHGLILLVIILPKGYLAVTVITQLNPS